MMRRFGVVLALAFFASGCAVLGGRDDSSDFDRETSADDARVREDHARTNLRTIEAALADYVKGERKIPEKLDVLVPKYLPAVPPLDLPACGPESDVVQVYSPEILRDGQVDGSRIGNTGHWGYVFGADRVVIFVDCLKASNRGVPWYQVRGVY